MTESKGYHLKIEFEVKELTSEDINPKAPNVKCTIYGDSAEEVMSHFNQFLREMDKIGRPSS